MTTRQLNDLVLGASAMVFAVVLLMLGEAFANGSTGSGSLASALAAVLLIAIQVAIFLRLGRVLDLLAPTSQEDGDPSQQEERAA